MSNQLWHLKHFQLLAASLRNSEDEVRAVGDACSLERVCIAPFNALALEHLRVLVAVLDFGLWERGSTLVLRANPNLITRNKCGKDYRNPC